MRSEPRQQLRLRQIAVLTLRELKVLSEERWFRAGLLLRALLVLLLVPEIQSRWFLPFLGQLLAGFDPYGSWLGSGGEVLAWPYGPAMSLAHLPTVLVGALAAPVWLASLSFGAVLIVADLVILLALRSLASDDAQPLVSKIWWLSPAALVIGYWHGQTDAVPLALLMASLAAFQARQWRWAGLLVGLSMAAKLTMAIVVPFLVIWLGASRRYRGKLAAVFLPLLGLPVLGYGLVLLSPGAWQMIFGSPVVGQISTIAVNLHGTPVMILPALLIALLYVAARARRLGFALMLGLLGTALFAMAAVLAVAPGWWLWALPFLALYAAKSSRLEIVIGVWIFSFVLALQTVVNATGAAMLFVDLPELPVPSLVESAGLTLLVALGLVLAISMFRHALADNDPYRLARHPLAIGIAGDSGSGKDTLSNALARIFGEREVVAVSGDDYHKWERGAPMWQVWTHLNPQANRLRDFTDDVRALTLGRSIKCRYYDHVTGRFEPRLRKHHNDIILVSGLHVLYGTDLRNALDVRIYLDMDEDLRRFFKLARDTTERNQAPQRVLEAIERRLPDRQAYLEPQLANADLVLRLEPIDPELIKDADPSADMPLRLKATIRNGLKFDDLSRLLMVMCWCQADVERVDGSGGVLFIVEGGDVTSEDIEEIAKLLIPHHDEILALEPRFDGGVTGIMQLLVLMEIESVRCRPV